MSKKIILLIIGIIVIGFVVYNFVKKEEAKFSLFKVERGNIVQEVSETGQVQVGEEISPGFKSSGTIQNIYVKVGDEVLAGANLIKLNTTELVIQLQEAQANLEVNQAKLNQLLAGSSAEEIKVAETALANAQQTLADVRVEAEEDLNEAYEDALVTLDGAYAKGTATLTIVTSIQQTYFYGNDQESIIVKAKKTAIEETLASAKEKIDAAKADASQANIDLALTTLRNSLNIIYDALVAIRDTTEVINYRNVVSSVNKTSLDTEKTNINTALTNVTNAQQTIASTKITNEKDINDAEGDIKAAEDDLALEKASPRQVDIDLYQAQVNQAQAKVDLLENQIWDSTLRSPVKGQVIAINKEVGETTQAALAESVITLLPANPYEIAVDIYEEDIIKMEVGDEAAISLVALPEKTFKGKVVSIKPAEKLVEGVVYYEVIISFDEETPASMKPGMTADLTVKTDYRENVLMIPEDGIQKKDDKNIVQVFKDGQISEREITIGLVGSDDMVEVLSGLDEGEEIILP